jgi:class 3 adenylate cyclase
LKVKIGINTGPVTAGVVGFHKPQFALVGDTVNTAARMGGTLTTPNSIQITKETYAHVSDMDTIDISERQVEAKGKGLLTTYVIVEKLAVSQLVPSR